MSYKSNSIVVDSFAWIEYLSGKSEKVAKIIENGELHTSIFSIVEIASRLERAEYARIEEAISNISNMSKIEGFDYTAALTIGKLHAKMRKKIPDFGVGDCFILELAERLGAKILTGDKHFKGLKNVIFIE